MKRNVVVWGTGNVGRPAIRSVVANQDLNLVGVIVSNPEKIGEEFKGENGFGYDPIFLVPEYKLHLAEMEKEEKNKISHRFKAFEVVTGILPSLIN